MFLYVVGGPSEILLTYHWNGWRESVGFSNFTSEGSGILFARIIFIVRKFKHPTYFAGGPNKSSWSVGWPLPFVPHSFRSSFLFIFSSFFRKKSCSWERVFGSVYHWKFHLIFNLCDKCFQRINNLSQKHESFWNNLKLKERLSNNGIVGNINSPQVHIRCKKQISEFRGIYENLKKWIHIVIKIEINYALCIMYKIVDHFSGLGSFINSITLETPNEYRKPFPRIFEEIWS